MLRRLAPFCLLALLAVAAGLAAAAGTPVSAQAGAVTGEAHVRERATGGTPCSRWP